MVKRYLTVEIRVPNKWGIFHDGKNLSTYEVCNLLNDYEDKLEVLLKGWKKVEYSGLLNLMQDYNLDWDSVYEIVKNSVEDNETLLTINGPITIKKG